MIRNKKIMILIVSAVIGCLLLSSCSFFSREKAEEEPIEEVPTVEQVEQSNMRNTILYYQDNDGYLIPVMRQIPWVEGIGKAALSKLISTTDNIMDAQEFGLKPVIPDGTTIDLNITEGTAKVDLSEDALEVEDAVQEANMVASIVNTLTEFPAVERVKILIDGKEKEKLKFGTNIGKEFKKMDLNLESAQDNIDVETASKLVLYFENENAPYLVPVTRLIGDSLSLDVALNELIEGPVADSALTTSVPADCKLLSVEIKDGVAIVNFSKEFEKIAEFPEKEKMALKSIILTCKQFPDVKDVKIQIEGKDYEPVDATSMTVPTFVNEY